MIGSTLITRSSRLVAERRARGDQRERESQQRRAGADQDREEHRVPGHAAAQARVQAIDAPDRAVEEAGDEIAFERASQHHEDREEHEAGDRRDHQPDRADYEGVAAAHAARRQSLAEKHEVADRREQRSQAHARLRRPPGGRDVGMAKKESLGQQQHEARYPGKDQRHSRAHAIPAPGRAASAPSRGRKSSSSHGRPWKPCSSAGAPHHEPSVAYHGSSARPAAVAAIQVTWVVL